MYDFNIQSNEDDWDATAPFSEPSDAEEVINDSHPRYDYALDEQEIYDEGLASASGLMTFTNHAQV